MSGLIDSIPRPCPAGMAAGLPMPCAVSLSNSDRQYAPVEDLAMQRERGAAVSSDGGDDHIPLARRDGLRDVERAPEVVDALPYDFIGGLLGRPHRHGSHLGRRRHVDTGKLAIVEETGGDAEGFAAVLLDVHPDGAGGECHGDMASGVRERDVHPTPREERAAAAVVGDCAVMGGICRAEQCTRREPLHHPLRGRDVRDRSGGDIMAYDFLQFVTRLRHPPDGE